MFINERSYLKVNHAFSKRETLTYENKDINKFISIFSSFLLSFLAKTDGKQVAKPNTPGYAPMTSIVLTLSKRCLWQICKLSTLIDASSCSKILSYCISICIWDYMLSNLERIG